MDQTQDPKSPDLREIVKKNEQSVYSFCFYMMGGDFIISDTVVEIFRRFGATFRQKDLTWEPLETRIRLFQVAWKNIRDGLSRVPFALSMGRDTRVIRKSEEDLIQSMKENRREEEAPILWRLLALDAELRVAVVLRDILKLEDEEVARILALRWGVYRHRLHRGRLELRDLLKGQKSVDAKRIEPKGIDAKGLDVPGG